HILFFGRKDNFWEMADTGPCGPCSEIHIDRGPDFCNKHGVAGHECGVNSDCQRFLELWNLVFIQYNRLSPTQLEPLPARHVDTGMGFERIVSVLQDVDSNYKTDLFQPMMDCVQELAGQDAAQRAANPTPYRVIADHSRAAAFLIADGVVPGNTGRNYVCRMIIRRAARFGGMLGLNEPFLAQVAEQVIQNYGAFYPELERNRKAIQEALTREEVRFRRTLEGGLSRLEDLLEKLRSSGEKNLSGDQAFDLYATFGLPFEITRDIAREQDLDVDEAGFRRAMDEHRLASGAGEAFGELGGEDVDVYRNLFEELKESGKLPVSGVAYDPYTRVEVCGPILALIQDGRPVAAARTGDQVEVLLPETCFYVESGGQVSDTGLISAQGEPGWEIQVEEARKPAAGLIVHAGKVARGQARLGDAAIARIDVERRRDIMRNHTATHLLHRELRLQLGEHARQAGSLVAPDRLRFDFTHPEGLSQQQLEAIEAGVNRAISANYPLNIAYKPLQEALAQGAIALFGEKYEETVRNITIGDEQVISNELCGGTHVDETGDIGIFLITSEGSVAAGIRRIEAVTGRAAYALAHKRIRTLEQAAELLSATPNQVVEKTQALLAELNQARKEAASLRQKGVAEEFERQLQGVVQVTGVTLLAARLPEANADALRNMADVFRQRYPKSAVAVLASVTAGRPMLVATVTDDMVKRGLHAGELVKHVAQPLGGGGGGKPTLAQAGGKDASRLDEALASVPAWIEARLKS
ncbi:MAG: alanine--tRNA ligase, partial [Anaerolineales bacterium]|nr:alanine--tRNA ligase [Anaerolineales bacterium]